MGTPSCWGGVLPVFQGINEITFTDTTVYSSVRYLVTAAVASFVCLVPLTSVGQQACAARNWEYSIQDLQEARRRLKSASIQTMNGKVTCAETILQSPGLAGPFTACEECARELAGLLADSAIFMRHAANETSADAASEKAYLEKEVVVRERLHEFLNEESQASIRDAYFNSNLQALADAMERVGAAVRYHQLMSALSEPRRLHVQVYRVWIKAVRSCAQWDFKSVDNASVLRQSLCSAECIESLRAVYAGLEAAGLVKSNGTVKTSMPLVPTPAECEH